MMTASSCTSRCARSTIRPAGDILGVGSAHPARSRAMRIHPRMAQYATLPACALSARVLFMDRSGDGRAGMPLSTGPHSDPSPIFLSVFRPAGKVERIRTSTTAIGCARYTVWVGRLSLVAAVACGSLRNEWECAAGYRYCADEMGPRSATFVRRGWAPIRFLKRPAGYRKARRVRLRG